MKAFAELNETRDRIAVHFEYSAEAVRAIKGVPGARFVPPPKGGPHWLCPLDLTSARRLREQFGMGLTLGAALRKWGKDQTAKERNLTSLAASDDAQLEKLPEIMPELAEFYRPYQRADVKFMSAANAICANQPGLGKTVEAIGAVYESDVDLGPTLVIAPKTSLEAVWLKELDRWLPEDVPVFVVSGDNTPDQRREIMEEVMELAEAGKHFWLVVNPAMVRYRENPERKEFDKKARQNGQNPDNLEGQPDAHVPAHPELFGIVWTFIIFDEYHKQGLTNQKTLTYKAANALEAIRKLLLSGTPMGGKPVKLWGALHFLEPQQYTSKWRWIDQWLETEETNYGKSVYGVKAGREEAFYQALAPHMVRRTKAEVAKQLPAKQIIDIWCEMTPRQKKQYDAMAASAEVKIEEENLNATSILAEYMRLKQFADARQKVRKLANGTLEVKPTDESGKLPYLLDLLDERGIRKEDPEGDEHVVIGSQFSSIVDMVCEYLNKQGIECAKITGATTQKQRTEIVEQFQAEGGPRVLAITTTAGGVAITLDRASTLVVLDETWDPDDQEQLEDRIHRISRIHQVTCYYLRSQGTIEEYIQQVAGGKAITNKEILDLRRIGLRATGEHAEVAA